MRSEYEHIRVIAGVYMDKRNWVIANIPVRKGLEERYGAHVNVASDFVQLYPHLTQGDENAILIRPDTFLSDDGSQWSN